MCLTNDSILVGIIIAFVGCSQSDRETPKGNVSSKKPANVSMSFDEAFGAGHISWQPVKNVELTTKAAGVSTTESTDFQVKFKYDEDDNRSIDKTGWKTYTWLDQEATFGPDAVIRLTQDANVQEGTFHVGDEWTWTGQQWAAKPKE